MLNQHTLNDLSSSDNKNKKTAANMIRLHKRIKHNL